MSCFVPVSCALIRTSLIAALVVAAAPAIGQDEEAGEAPPAASEPARVLPSGAAYMKPMGRLSTILGSVHFLRTLCGDETAGLWRRKMDELLVAQSPNEADRQILVAAFNGGYRAFESTYRQCTPAARVAVARYQEEGAVLSREISARYGN
ncbi:MAG: TIGR02301 family protein [Rhizobiaceae bacterium]|nr:TIGR02301 family protein [Rhizobiaceae bacterium]